MKPERLYRVTWRRGETRYRQTGLTLEEAFWFWMALKQDTEVVSCHMTRDLEPRRLHTESGPGPEFSISELSYGRRA